MLPTYSIPYTAHTNSAKLGQVTSRISGVLRILEDISRTVRNFWTELSITYSEKYSGLFK